MGIQIWILDVFVENAETHINQEQDHIHFEHHAGFMTLMKMVNVNNVINIRTIFAVIVIIIKVKLVGSL